MNYSVNMVYSKSDFIAITKATLYQNENVKKKQSISQIIFSILGIISIFMGTLSIVKSFRVILFGGGDVPIMNIVVPAIFIAIGFILILGSDSSKIGTNMWKHYKEKGSVIEYSFYPDHFIISTQSGKKKVRYSNIKTFTEDWTRYFLFTDINVGYIISKKDLNLDDHKEFADFISKQSGVKLT